MNWSTSESDKFCFFASFFSHALCLTENQTLSFGTLRLEGEELIGFRVWQMLLLYTFLVSALCLTENQTLSIAMELQSIYTFQGSGTLTKMSPIRNEFYLSTFHSHGSIVDFTFLYFSMSNVWDAKADASGLSVSSPSEFEVQASQDIFHIL